MFEDASNERLEKQLSILKEGGHRIDQICDEQGYTLIIHAVLKAVPDKVLFLINRAKLTDRLSAQ